MKNILVAIDFSETSKTAYFYALRLAEELGAKLSILHSISIPIPTDTGIVSTSYEIPLKIAEDRIDYFVYKLPLEKHIRIPNIEIESYIITGAPAYTISQFAKENDVDLIIMGTIEKSSIIGRMVGSITSATVNKSECPVLLIHKNTRYVKPKNIVFGLDHKGNLEEALAKFNDINNQLMSFTEFVHVKGKRKELIALVKSEVVHELVDEKTAEYSFEIKAIDGDNPAQDIIDYCVFSKSDLLVLIHHEANFFKRLFTKSISLNAAELIHLPVLIIPSKF